ncbi:MAG: hypothetical protein U0U09_12315 [Cyclobacteriaceae bacterium]
MTPAKFFIFLAIVCSPLLTIAQKRITVVDIRDVASAYVDRPGDLYILHTDNKVSKFDTLGMPVADMGFERKPTIFDPRDGARMFIYFADVKQGSFFSVGTSQGFFIYDYFAMEPMLATSAGDNQVWIIDKGDWSLKKLDPKASKIVAEATIDKAQFQTDPDFTAVREYQNFLFVLDKNAGILIFNGIGKQIKKIEGKDIPYFNFLGEELYYKKNDKLIFYDLFDGTTREESIDSKCLYTLLTDARKYVVYADRIEVFGN